LGGGIRRGVCGALGVRIWCVIVQFLRSLLQFYGPELHYLTLSGILHMAAFVTLCEAYMGIEPHFDLWNYIFHARLQQVLDAEAVVMGSMDLFV
jgi:hypothetical protein